MRSFQIFGEASIATGTGGGGALEELGISVDGVTMTINENIDEVYIDTYGPKTAVDAQLMLYTIEITADLIYYDMSVIQKWMAQDMATLPGFGSFGKAGLLAVANNASARVLVRSTPANVGLVGAPFCWNFPKATLIDAQEIKIGVKMNPWKVKWKAWPTFQTSTTNGSALFNTTCS